jgi:hypothetical protein
MTVTLLQLWMPILLGTFLAWIASAIIHVVIKVHNSDYQALSNEDEVTVHRNWEFTRFLTALKCPI